MFFVLWPCQQSVHRRVMDIVLFFSVALTVLLSGNLATAEDRQGSGPSAESLRRYLALYEQQRQLDRLKSNYYATRFTDNPAEGQDAPNPGYDGPRVDGGNWQQQQDEYLSWRTSQQPSKPAGWRGPGQPEVAPSGGVPELPDEDTLVNLQYYAAQERQQNGNTGEPSSWSTSTKNDQDLQESGQQEIKKSEQQSGGPAGGSTSSFKSDAGLPFAQPLMKEEAEQAKKQNPLGDVYFVVIVAGCSAAAIFGVIAAGYCFYRFQKNSKAAAEVDYPAYGVTGPNKDQTSPNGDRRLAQSAQMYHYQHQKQQMIAVEKATTPRNTSASDIDSEEENEEGDYTVYECPGLAPTGEMEVKNPLFQDDSTPMSPPVVAKDIKKP